MARPDPWSVALAAVIAIDVVLLALLVALSIYSVLRLMARG